MAAPNLLKGGLIPFDSIALVTRIPFLCRQLVVMRVKAARRVEPDNAVVCKRFQEIFVPGAVKRQKLRQFVYDKTGHCHAAGGGVVNHICHPFGRVRRRLGDVTV
ncbi:hypothetical protein [Roseobacter sp.]|uniref:hypothetical protein n=1 Tax=Roseobacter sp. TaxID=1907202 RepID=UPI00329A1B31